jgi:ribosomal protein S27AE
MEKTNNMDFKTSNPKCPQCGEETMPEYAHNKCLRCGYIIPCCEIGDEFYEL